MHSRLSILHTESSNGWGGQEIRILVEASGLRARGHDVTLVAANGARIVDEAPRYGVPVEALPIGRNRPAGWIAMTRALRDRRPDIVNSHSSTDTWLAALACRTIGRGAPALVRTRHVSVPVRNDVATRWLYHRATTRIVTTGESLRATLVRDNGLPASRVESVPTGVAPDAFGRLTKREARARLRLPEDAPLIGIVATLRSWKGHRYLIDALPHIARVDARLVIVGDGPQREALTHQATESGFASRVLFAGQQDDVAPWLAALDVFALPSYANEGVPQALIQAMFARVPCVTTNAGAIGEIAHDGHTATIVAKQDAVALANGIDRLLRDSAAATAQASRAHALVSAQCTLDAMLDRMEAVFARAVQERRA
ncbi:MAG TPA: glycosyltransferase family 4 protein [Casimicrobiaceae bacterium]|nr:glycosyltransferase family 4 protein [Casimicrobiaceae bacterium]